MPLRAYEKCRATTVFGLAGAPRAILSNVDSYWHKPLQLRRCIAVDSAVERTAGAAVRLLIEGQAST